jgi:biotin carboxyl carrier protein
MRIQIGSSEPKIMTEEDIDRFKNEMDILRIDPSSYSLIYKNKSYEISILKIDRESKSISLTINGTTTDIKVSTKMDLLLEKMGIDTTASQKLAILKAPMPGLVIEWFVSEGDSVQAGDKILVLEAMKMENVIKSPGEGIVKKIMINKGTAIEKNQVLIEFS